MIGLSPFIRRAPKLFYVVAVVDLLKNLLPFEQYFVHGRFAGIDYDLDLRLQLFSGLLGAVVYAASWVAYGIFASLLIAIHDRVAAREPAGPDPEAPE
jgi:hypothetical protein